MFERNDDIARNTLELLRSQKQTLLTGIAAGEARLAELEQRSSRDRRLSFGLAFSIALAVGLALAFQLRPPPKLSWTWYW